MVENHSPSPQRPNMDDDNNEVENGADGAAGEEIEADGDDDSFEEMDMIEIVDDDDEDGIDQGDMADVEDEGDGQDEGASAEQSADLVGLTCQAPDYMLHPHKGTAVFCSTFDNSGTKLITGGEDDTATVWDSTSIKTQFPIFRCDGHDDSVVCASFSSDAVYFSTCDLAGKVKVWKTDSTECICTFETGDLSWSFWHFGAHVLFAGCDDGSIYMWKIPDETCKIFSGSSAKSECATLLPDGKRLVAGYADGTLKMFDLKSGDTEQTFVKSKAHSDGAGVLSVHHHPTRGIVAAGRVDGLVKVFNVQNGKILHSIRCSPQRPNLPVNEADDGDNIDSVETVSFYTDPQSQLDLLAAGSIKGHLVIWDATNMSERLRMKQGAGLTKFVWNPKVPIMYTAGLDGVVRIIDFRKSSMDSYLGKHKSEVLDMAVTKTGDKLVSASEDGLVLIFILKQSAP